MDSREDIPRIAIETLQTWQRLQSEFHDASVNHLENEIHRNGLVSEKDALMAHMTRFIEQTLAMAQPNLRVNGQACEDLDQDQHGEHQSAILHDVYLYDSSETEQFDEALDRRVWSLADNRLQWFKRIAETRRKVPRDMADAVKEAIEAHRNVPEGAQTVDTDGVDEDVEEDLMTDTLQDNLQYIKSVTDEFGQTLSSQSSRAKNVKSVATDLKSIKL
ncbi:hypothetical protein AMATHDRAFT_6515 [Amanita thiersii Skay4041]|uniref:Uncharacterized protein n=1 Tax=Amanita thiersii Skay4041 TaxID=703135 RepID=A0A2A9NC64_9AGAR|nr:hypothetical protein AMATHDRAFT_6515 [Amanita thiersii Skay4041]